MKSLLIILFLTPFISQAQFWVEDNAVWHYDFWNIGTEGFYKINHTGTATIDAIPCSEYTIDSYNFYYFPFGGGSYLFSGTNTIATEYIHASNDTVYRWDGNEHRVIFDFGAQVGDEWIFDINTNPFGLICNDTSRVVVTATGMENIAGENYRYIELQSPYDSYYSMSGHYNERFAGDYPFPQPQNCDPGVVVEFDMLGNLRCFSDDSLDLNFVSEDCEYLLIHSGLDDLEGGIGVYPNPTSGDLFINNSEIIKIEVSTNDGRKIEVLEFANPVEKFSIGHLKPGVYFLNLYDQKGHVFVKKIALKMTE